MSKTLTVDEITAKFRIKKLTEIEGEPTYEAISKLSQELYTNAATLASPLGGGQHGHIGMVMKPSLYESLSNIPYVTPKNPGPTPKFDDAKIYTEMQRMQVRDDHKLQLKTYTEHHNMDAALQQQLTEAVEYVYLAEKCNRFTGYLGVSTRDLLDHLLERYGNITAADLHRNKEQMNEPVDVNMPIDTYFKRIEDCLQYASDANNPFTEEQVLQTTFFALQATGLYKDGLKEWRVKPKTEQTWEAFKSLFTREYHLLKEEERVTSGASGYKTMHNAEDVTNEIASAIDNLAMATTTDRSILEQLVAASKELTEANARLTEQVHKLMQGTVCQPVPKVNKNRERRLKYEARLDPNGYCWTHGYRVVKGHTSKTCHTKAPGHQDEATRANTMGGSESNKSWKPSSE